MIPYKLPWICFAATGVCLHTWARETLFNCKVFQSSLLSHQEVGYFVANIQSIGISRKPQIFKASEFPWYLKSRLLSSSFPIVVTAGPVTVAECVSLQRMWSVRFCICLSFCLSVNISVHLILYLFQSYIDFFSIIIFDTCPPVLCKLHLYWSFPWTVWFWVVFSCFVCWICQTCHPVVCVLHLY